MQSGIGELLAECRVKVTTTLKTSTIIMESNGKISVLPMSATRPVTPEDINISPIQATPLANIIIDGKTMKGNLKFFGKDEEWLKNKLKQKKASDIREVILATYDPAKDDINVYFKYHKKYKVDIFE